MSAFSMADVRTQARRDIHDASAVPAVYADDSLEAPVDVRVRWHSRLASNGAAANGFDAVVIEGIQRLVWSSEELAVAIPGDPPSALTLKRGGTVTITWPTGEVAEFELDQLEPQDGPINVAWSVVKI